MHFWVNSGLASCLSKRNYAQFSIDTSHSKQPQWITWVFSIIQNDKVGTTYRHTLNQAVCSNLFIEKISDNHNQRQEKFHRGTGVHHFRVHRMGLLLMLFHLIIYLLSLLGNLTLMSPLICTESQLHNPCTSLLETYPSWTSGMLLSMPLKSWWPVSLTTNSSPLPAEWPSSSLLDWPTLCANY